LTRSVLADKGHLKCINDTNFSIFKNIYSDISVNVKDILKMTNFQFILGMVSIDAFFTFIYRCLCTISAVWYRCSNFDFISKGRVVFIGLMNLYERTEKLCMEGAKITPQWNIGTPWLLLSWQKEYLIKTTCFAENAFLLPYLYGCRTFFFKCPVIKITLGSRQQLN
jgi:hypothetical protein